MGESIQKPLISIVVIVWGDYYKYLDECLESIKKQTFKDYEVIVVEDKNTISSARNAGIERAKGEWILPLDVDDTLEPDFLEKMADKMENGVGIIGSRIHEYGERENIFTPAPVIAYDGLLYGNQIYACSLFPKKVWQEVGGYDEEIGGYEDWEYWLRILLAGYKYVMADTIYNYRVHSDSSLRKMEAQHEELMAYIRNKHRKVYKEYEKSIKE